MTDFVRCTADSPNTFSCEVELDSDFETLTCEAPDPAPALLSAPTALPPAAVSSPAVSLLVSSFVSKTVVLAPPAPLITGAALLECASTELSVVLAAAGASQSPILAALTMLKAGLETSHCLALAHNEAAQRNARDYCTAQGGVVTGVEGEKTICEVRETLK